MKPEEAIEELNHELLILECFIFYFRYYRGCGGRSHCDGAGGNGEG